MLIEELAREVHRNAIEHGWWDEERSIYQIAALIHSEWSEALEEARAGRPPVYKLDIDREDLRFVTPDDPAYAISCAKPEGIAVELADGCIRILDLLGFLEARVDKPGSDSPSDMEDLWNAAEATGSTPENVGTLVCLLHMMTSDSLPQGARDEIDYASLMGAMGAALQWIRMQGIDPMQVIAEKHEYNKTRPYKHGKKF